jgi:putative transposase
VFRWNGPTVIRTPPYTPVANAYTERWVGTVRRELLDRTLVWHRRQLEQLLRDYIEHYNNHRPHRSLGQHAPDNRVVARGSSTPQKSPGTISRARISLEELHPALRVL